MNNGPGREEPAVPDGSHLRGQKRTYYSARLLALCVTTAVCASAVTSILTALVVSSNANRAIYDQDIASCHRQDQTRVESNKRIPAHKADRDNLTRLADRIAHTRDVEAEVFIQLGHRFHIERDVHPLVVALRDAAREDRAIAANQRAHVTFRPLAIFDCGDPRVVRHP